MVLEFGKVLSVKDGVVRASGIHKVSAGEMVKIGEVFGMVLNLEIDIVSIVVFGQDTTINEGDKVERSNSLMSIKVGNDILGRVVNVLGNPIDGKGPIKTTEIIRVERKASGIITIKSVNERVQTGNKIMNKIFHLNQLNKKALKPRNIIYIQKRNYSTYINKYPHLIIKKNNTYNQIITRNVTIPPNNACKVCEWGKKLITRVFYGQAPINVENPYNITKASYTIVTPILKSAESKQINNVSQFLPGKSYSLPHPAGAISWCVSDQGAESPCLKYNLNVLDCSKNFADCVNLFRFSAVITFFTHNKIGWELRFDLRGEANHFKYENIGPNPKDNLAQQHVNLINPIPINSRELKIKSLTYLNKYRETAFEQFPEITPQIYQHNCILHIFLIFGGKSIFHEMVDISEIINPKINTTIEVNIVKEALQQETLANVEIQKETINNKLVLYDHNKNMRALTIYEKYSWCHNTKPKDMEQYLSDKYGFKSLTENNEIKKAQEIKHNNKYHG